MFEQLKNIYGGKKVFLTGHTGFKGAWLLKTLNMLGAEVKGYALAPKTETDLFWLINGNEICDSVIEDLRNRKRLLEEIANFQPDFIFHLAAQPLVRLSYQIPSETFEVNAIGTANLLDGVRFLNKACNVVLITTDKVYHNNEWLYPYRETDRLGGYDPYSASKACAELVIDSYRNSFFHKDKYQEHQKAIAVGRAGNVIGGGDWSADRLIPDIVKSLSINKKIIIRNPLSIRPWQHVIEPVMGYLVLGAKQVFEPLKFSQAYNFGPESTDAITVVEIVNLATQAWGNGSYEVKQESDYLHEAGLLKLDITKARTELDWKPKMNASQAINRTIEWYKHFSVYPEDIHNFTEDQIKEYMND
jgi:CDP-glucose 4,6-dehydratase